MSPEPGISNMNNSKSVNLLSSLKKEPLLLWGLAAIILIRLVFTGIMGMMPQDAYYFFYSRHLALSYFDHPPAIAYVLRLFTSIFGQHVISIKLAALITTALTGIAFFQLCKLFVEREKLNRPVLLMLSTLMFSILSLIATPDVPLLLFWTLSLLSVHKAVFAGNKWHWLLSGLLMGLAFDSKYTAVFLPMGLLLFLLLSAAHRKHLHSPWFWSGALVFLITISPVIIWNFQNEFASFRFQTSARASTVDGFQIDPVLFLGVLGHEAALLIPVLFFGLLFFLFRSFRKIKQWKISIDQSTTFLLCFFLPVFLLFMSISFFYWVKLNWMMPAYITGVIWVSRFFTVKWIRFQMLFSLVIHLALVVELVFYPFPVQSDDTWFGWDKLAAEVKLVRAADPDAFIFSADDYKTSAVLNFYFDEKVYFPNVVGERALQLDFMPNDLPALEGKDAFFIDSSPRFDDEKKSGTIPDKLSGYFSSVEELEPILIKNRGITVRKFLVYHCSNYRPGFKKAF